MPKIGQKRKPEVVELTDFDIAKLDEEALEKFSDPLSWKRSRKGNMWRHWEGATVTIFTRSDGYYGWSASNNEQIRYSPCGFETEDEAMEYLGEHLGVRDSWMD